MTFKSPLARVARTSRTTEARRPIIPERLRLPDGREFDTADLVGRVTKSVNYNLRGRNPHRPLAKPATKYNSEDHRWILRASLEEIQQRYGLNPSSARQLRYRAERLRHTL